MNAVLMICEGLVQPRSGLACYLRYDPLVNRGIDSRCGRFFEL